MNKNNQDPWADLAMTQAAMEYYRILDENEELAQRMTIISLGFYTQKFTNCGHAGQVHN